MEYSRTQIDLLQVKPASLEPYPGPFLQPGIRRRIRLTAILRSFGRPDKKGYRKAAKAATGEASTYAERNCAKYFEFQFVWPELMGRLENDQTLRAALVESVTRRYQEAEEPRRAGRIAAAQGAGIDPGATGEIHLNLAE